MDISELNRAQSLTSINRHPWEIARAKAIRFLLKQTRVSFTHLTDIGSGDTFLLRYLAANKTATDYKAVDTAYTPDLIDQLKKLSHTEAIDFRMGYDEQNKQNTDCVTLLDVLEHCVDDHAVLASATNSHQLQDDSVVLITVPAFHSLFSQHDKLLGHYRRYNRKQLKNLCRNNQLEIVHTGYFFFSLLPVRLFQLLLEKAGVRKTVKSIDNWNGGRLMNRIISSILWADFRVCFALSKAGIHLPGLSCYCLCRKLRS